MPVAGSAATNSVFCLFGGILDICVFMVHNAASIFCFLRNHPAGLGTTHCNPLNSVVVAVAPITLFANRKEHKDYV